MVFWFQPTFISRYTLRYTRCVTLLQLFILCIHSSVQAIYCFRGVVKMSYSLITDVYDYSVTTLIDKNVHYLTENR